MRRVRAGRSLKSNWRIHNSVVGAGALVDRGGIYVRLERRADLAQSLRGAIELGNVEIAASDHGLDFAGGVIDRDERAFGSRILFQADARFSLRIERQDFDVNDVADVKHVGKLELRLSPSQFRRR